MEVADRSGQLGVLPSQEAARMGVRVPQLTDSIVIRPAETSDEIARANRLVYNNYVAEGYWDDDAKQLHDNKWLNSNSRDVFVAIHGTRLVGTVSLIHDSAGGLPSDRFQPRH